MLFDKSRFPKGLKLALPKSRGILCGPMFIACLTKRYVKFDYLKKILYVSEEQQHNCEFSEIEKFVCNVAAQYDIFKPKIKSFEHL